MNHISEKPEYRPFKPTWSSDCLCGSGKKFAKCCRKRLPGHDIGKAWREAARDGKWHIALLHCRADIAQYTIWHRSHTDPIHLGLKGKNDSWIFKVDIEALSDLLINLSTCYSETGQMHKLASVLDRLRPNINDFRWLKKISYHKAICALMQGDRAEAAICLHEVGPITPSTEDVDLLQAHIDLHGHRMGLSEKLSFCDAVVKQTTLFADKLQYRAGKGFSLVASSDFDGARKEFAETIKLGRAEEGERPFTIRAEHWFCKNLEGLAVIDENPTLFRELAVRLEKLSRNENLSDQGTAMILQMLGDCNRYSGNPAAALDAYNQSLALSHNETTQIFTSECLMRLGRSDEAMKLLSEIDRAALDESGELDFAFTYFSVAKARENRIELSEARQNLEKLESQDPFFEKIRLEYIIDASRTIEALMAGEPVPETGAVIDAMRRLSRYAQLQPNLFGVGININNVIDDLVAAAEERARKNQTGKED